MFFKPSILQFIFLFILLTLIACNDELDFDSASEDTIEVMSDFKNRTCNAHEHTIRLLADPEYKERHDQLLNAFEKLNSQPRLKAQCANPVSVPVAIHFQGVNNPNENCLRDLTIDQINRINLDYAGENSDISNWNNQASSSFPGVSNGEMCVKFVIADKNHPSGYGLNDGDLAITFNRTQGDQVNNWSGYLNIFVQFNTGVLGYAPLGGQGNGDGVVIDAVGFGAGSGCGSVAPEAPFDLGRTLTHEIGHYLLLDHIWGNGCNRDDDVNDTPNQSSDYNGCPSIGATSCGSTDMHMNYMDYTNDACMYMFSDGQVSRMTNYLEAALGGLISNASNVFSGADPGSGGGGGSGGGAGDVCETPSNSTVTIRSATSVRVNWDAQPDAIRYQIIYRVKGTSSWTRKGTRKTFRNLNGLQLKLYEYRLRTRCPNGWTAWSPKKTFDLSDNGGGQPSDEYRVAITLDDYGSETDWYLYDEFNNLLKSGGPYADGQSGTVKTSTVTLEDGCYEIDLYDSYGDGICCDYGNGKMEILNSNDNVIAGSDGLFGSYELIQFCIENGSARIINREKDAKTLNRGDKKK